MEPVLSGRQRPPDATMFMKMQAVTEIRTVSARLHLVAVKRLACFSTTNGQPNATISMKIKMLTLNSDSLNLIASSCSQKTCALRQDLQGDFRENKKMQDDPTMFVKTKSRRNDILRHATMFYILKLVMLGMPRCV